MMNFRYHLVSLIAVFTALAIGVILGAGPLQSRIASVVSQASPSVAGQVSEQSSAMLNAESAGVRAIGKQLSSGTLQDIKVGIVALPDATAADIDGVKAAVTAAGGHITAQVTLDKNWDLVEMSTFRETLSSALSSNLTNPLPADSTADHVIGQAIVEAMTTSGAKRDLLVEILGDESTPMMKIDSFEAEAQGIIAIGPRATTPGAGAQRASSTWIGLGQAMNSLPTGGVILGDATYDDSPLVQVRAANIPLVSVDSVGTASAEVFAVFALKSAKSDQSAFGSQKGAVKDAPALR